MGVCEPQTRHTKCPEQENIKVHPRRLSLFLTAYFRFSSKIVLPQVLWYCNFDQNSSTRQDSLQSNPFSYSKSIDYSFELHMKWPVSTTQLPSSRQIMASSIAGASALFIIMRSSTGTRKITVITLTMFRYVNQQETCTSCLEQNHRSQDLSRELSSMVYSRKSLISKWGGFCAPLSYFPISHVCILCSCVEVCRQIATLSDWQVLIRY